MTPTSQPFLFSAHVHSTSIFRTRLLPENPDTNTNNILHGPARNESYTRYWPSRGIEHQEKSFINKRELINKTRLKNTIPPNSVAISRTNAPTQTSHSRSFTPFPFFLLLLLLPLSRYVRSNFKNAHPPSKSRPSSPYTNIAPKPPPRPQPPPRSPRQLPRSSSSNCPSHRDPMPCNRGRSSRR